MKHSKCQKCLINYNELEKKYLKIMIDKSNEFQKIIKDKNLLIQN
jgi:hypothetical protein